MGRTFGKYGVEERRIKEFSGTPAGKSALGRLRSRWEENIK